MVYPHTLNLLKFRSPHRSPELSNPLSISITKKMNKQYKTRLKLK